MLRRAKLASTSTTARAWTVQLASTLRLQEQPTAVFVSASPCWHSVSYILMHVGHRNCPAGSFCTGGQPAAVPCWPGTYSSAGATTCTACAVGKTDANPVTGFTRSSEASTCTSCPAGRTSLATGTAGSLWDGCVPCPVGTACAGGTSPAVTCSGGVVTSDGTACAASRKLTSVPQWRRLCTDFHSIQLPNVVDTVSV